MEQEKKKNWFTSLFTDKEWDFDLSKVIGFICIACALFGFFMEKQDFIALLTAGTALLGISKAKGD